MSTRNILYSSSFTNDLPILNSLRFQSLSPSPSISIPLSLPPSCLLDHPYFFHRVSVFLILCEMSAHESQMGFFSVHLIPGGKRSSHRRSSWPSDWKQQPPNLLFFLFLIFPLYFHSSIWFWLFFLIIVSSFLCSYFPLPIATSTNSHFFPTDPPLYFVYSLNSLINSLRLDLLWSLFNTLDPSLPSFHRSKLRAVLGTKWKEKGGGNRKRGN